MTRFPTLAALVFDALALLGGGPTVGAGAAVDPFEGVESVRIAVFVGGPGTPGGQGGIRLFSDNDAASRSFEEAVLREVEQGLSETGIDLKWASLDDIAPARSTEAALTVSVWGRSLDGDGLPGWSVYSLQVDIGSFDSRGVVESRFSAGAIGVARGGELVDALAQTTARLLSLARPSG